MEKAPAYTFGSWSAGFFLNACVKLHISPDLLTGLWGGLMVAAGMYIAFDGFSRPWIVVPVLLASLMLDGLDGKVARARYLSSEFGSLLDILTHLVGDAGILAGGTIAVVRASGSALYWINTMAVFAAVAGVRCIFLFEALTIAEWHAALRPKWCERVGVVHKVFRPFTVAAAVVGLVLGPQAFIFLVSLLAYTEAVSRLIAFSVIEKRAIRIATRAQAAEMVAPRLKAIHDNVVARRSAHSRRRR